NGTTAKNLSMVVDNRGTWDMAASTKLNVSGGFTSTSGTVKMHANATDRTEVVGDVSFSNSTLNCEGSGDCRITGNLSMSGSYHLTMGTLTGQYATLTVTGSMTLNSGASTGIVSTSVDGATAGTCDKVVVTGGSVTLNGTNNLSLDTDNSGSLLA